MSNNTPLFKTESPWPENPVNIVLDVRNRLTAFSTFLISSLVYTVISTSGDRTSNHRRQSRNSTTEELVHIKWNRFHINLLSEITPDVACKLHLYSYKEYVYLQGYVFPRGQEIRIHVIITSWAKFKKMYANTPQVFVFSRTGSPKKAWEPCRS